MKNRDDMDKAPSTAGAPSGLHPDVPLNVQLYNMLRQEIEDGVWEGRTDFPGEAELAQCYGVSVITSRAALERLTKENLIQRGRGRRTVALSARRRMNESPKSVMPSSGEKTFAYQLLSAGAGVAPAEACEAYGLPPGSELWICRRLRHYKGRPHSVTLNVQLVAIGALHRKKALTTLPMAESLQEVGAKFTKMMRRVGVGFPPQDVAKHLGITIHHPTLIYTFMLLEPGKLPVEWVRIYVHPDEQQHWETFDVSSDRGKANAKV